MTEIYVRKKKKIKTGGRTPERKKEGKDTKKIKQTTKGLKRELSLTRDGDGGVIMYTFLI
jgi:hypothetical protein